MTITMSAVSFTDMTRRSASVVSIRSRRSSLDLRKLTSKCLLVRDFNFLFESGSLSKMSQVVCSLRDA